MRRLRRVLTRTLRLFAYALATVSFRKSVAHQAGLLAAPQLTAPICKCEESVEGAHPYISSLAVPAIPPPTRSAAILHEHNKHNSGSPCIETGSPPSHVRRDFGSWPIGTVVSVFNLLLLLPPDPSIWTASLSGAVFAQVVVYFRLYPTDDAKIKGMVRLLLHSLL